MHQKLFPVQKYDPNFKNFHLKYQDLILSHSHNNVPHEF